MPQPAADSLTRSIEDHSDGIFHESVTKPYSVSSHVRACAVNKSVVLLDLRQNKYMMLPPPESAALAGLVNQWPTSAVHRQTPADTVRDFARMLHTAGVLTTESVDTTETYEDARPAYDLLASEDEVEQHRTINVGHVINFVYACVKAALAVRFGSLQTLALTVTTNRTRAAEAGISPGSQAVLELVDIFSRIRPFVFTARNHCLFHSLALLTFLSRYMIVPQWVIGVKLNPWGAHSWLESGDKVLDSTPEKVTEYSQIFEA
jgi:hypothetical protein